MASLAANESLRVRRIAASPLLTCGTADELKDVLSGPDQIPITDNGGRIVALWSTHANGYDDDWMIRYLFRGCPAVALHPSMSSRIG